MRVFVVPVYDRLSFTDLKSLVRDYLQHEVKFHPATRPVYILGESFGGLLAIAAALDSPELVDRLVLVNPATSFSQTIWPVIGPLLTQLPRDVFESALPIAMAPILGNPVGLLASALDNIPQGESITNVAAKLSQAALDLLAQLPELAKILPPETLAHKLEQLALGSDEIEGRLGEVQQRCLILVGDADMLLPSGEEGKRLERQLPRAQLREFRGRSHAFLQEGGIHLSNILIEEGFYVKERRMSAPLKKRASGAASFGSAVPVELPTDAELERYAERTTALGKRLTSPVFLSTAADGSIAYGLGNVPNRQLGKSILFVGNHQTLALDIGVLTEELIRQKGILPRGLAHPVIFSDSFGGDKEAIGNTEEMSQNNSSTKTTTGLAPWDLIPALSNFMLNSNAGGGIGNRRQDRSSSSSLSSSGSTNSNNPTDSRSAFKDFMQTFGAVRVSGLNMHRLLSNGEAVLLFPGGVREAYRRKGENYKLFWPDQSEFVRMAARFGATIVPFAAIGVDDGLEILLDSDEMKNSPFFGDRLRKQEANMPQARRGLAADKFGEEESFISPFVAPKVPPNRLYFVFQRPITTSPEDANDRKKCDAVYKEVKTSVEDGLAYLLKKREADPFKDFPGRFAYESLFRGRQAPTFPLNDE
jgi:pimeloyl-ACP methyl ester carboxylesterase/1-acyl-sn-glycerol-3-phosphate acyltransferase